MNQSVLRYDLKGRGGGGGGLRALQAYISGDTDCLEWAAIGEVCSDSKGENALYWELWKGPLLTDSMLLPPDPATAEVT